MTEENKLRLKQLGWGQKSQTGHGSYGRTLNQTHKGKTMAEVHALKLEKELLDVKAWLERLANRYREKGYDARPIDKMVERIRKAMM